MDFLTDIIASGVARGGVRKTTRTKVPQQGDFLQLIGLPRKAGLVYSVNL